MAQVFRAERRIPEGKAPSGYARRNPPAVSGTAHASYPPFRNGRCSPKTRPGGTDFPDHLHLRARGHSNPLGQLRQPQDGDVDPRNILDLAKLPCQLPIACGVVPANAGSLHGNPQLASTYGTCRTRRTSQLPLPLASFPRLAPLPAPRKERPHATPDCHMHVHNCHMRIRASPSVVSLSEHADQVPPGPRSLPPPSAASRPQWREAAEGRGYGPSRPDCGHGWH
jgi:hypothetical protein